MPSILSIWCFLASLYTTASARSPHHLGRRVAERLRDNTESWEQHEYLRPQLNFRNAEPLVPQNENTTKYAVDGKKIPEVDFDIGESYAGLIPTTAKNTSSLYFWYFPTSNPDGKDDLTIWLNGGPGCSSLEGLLQENGPFLWNYGTFKPVQNPWTWVRLTNMVWVEQPVGTGFSRGAATEQSQEAVAKTFISWFKNFIDTFGLHGKKIYIAGESYAGYFVPYIADAMFAANDKKYFDVKGTMIYDPVINSDAVSTDVPVVPYVDAFDNIFRLNDTYMASIRQRAQSCGYYDYLAKYMTFPPPGPIPHPTGDEQCFGIWQEIKKEATIVNPCFNMYQITSTCPLLWDVLGFPGSFEYLPAGSSIYFDRADVKKAINAPVNVKWAECKTVPLTFMDASEPSSYKVLPRVIERSERTIISHGTLDYILMTNGTLLSIQNMTWNGAQGFQKKPSADFFVPYHKQVKLSSVSGSGVQGIVHTERGLTWVEVFLSGHMVPQYTPSTAYRQLEFLLGRVSSMSERTPFTTEQTTPQPRKPSSRQPSKSQEANSPPS